MIGAISAVGKRKMEDNIKFEVESRTEFRHRGRVERQWPSFSSKGSPCRSIADPEIWAPRAALAARLACRQPRRRVDAS